jgi:hypothetical protein
MRTFLLAAIPAVLLGGCWNEQTPSKEAIARVGEKRLDAVTVRTHVPEGLNPDDSLNAVERYVDQWIREQIVVLQAETALASESIAFEEELAAYRNALLLHAFKERYVNDRLNTEVTEEEALEYYKANEQSFVLTDYAVRALFIHAPVEADMDLAREAIATLDSTGFLELERWCVENGAVYALDGSNWWTLSTFTKEVPMNFYRTEAQLSSRRPIEFEAEGRTFLVRFLEHALKDNVAPFSAVREEVVEMIIHRRRQALLLAMEEQLVVRAWAEGKVERY